MINILSIFFLSSFSLGWSVGGERRLVDILWMLARAVDTSYDLNE